jgi:protoheme IX farnesyltransferase
MLSSLSRYYSLAKPGIVYGNLITVLAGYLFAAKSDPDVLTLVFTSVGISLVIASGCVVNNIIDIDIDAKMQRTKDRVLVRGLISPSRAYLYALFLGSIGAYLLGAKSGGLALLFALVGLFFYVFVYSLWAKRAGAYGTLLGSVSGAMPIMVGYAAGGGALDLVALLLFLIMVVWQMPHSYAIAVMRLSDYEHARIPVLPVEKGVARAKRSMFLYTLAFSVLALSLYATRGLSSLFLVGTMTLSSLWIVLSLIALRSKEDRRDARRVFFASLLVIVGFSVFLSIG